MLPLRTLFHPLLALLLTAALTACGNDSAQQPAADKPTQRPAFSLPDLQGQTRRISEWDGQVVLLNFWAPWCPPCRKEIPAFLELQEKYAARGLRIVGVTLDTRNNAQDFADTYGIDYPLLIGEDAGIEIAQQYGNTVSALPYTVIIDRQGLIRHTHRNELSFEQAEAFILPLL